MGTENVFEMSNIKIKSVLKVKTKVVHSNDLENEKCENLNSVN